ncbi:GntR family transcriptional regulator [Neorhizobium sp. BETTINA12A]|uniref:GntR family transcriptional regulator n=1 Tax=Neorhizobium sp. BETTINA12A TaxID=2908924 RepID=UPI001FF20EEE|nr:GntR family transcriptional regulator [Neorhizobium sp. BETTINA12A]MCJ9750772.1 GntR family transcriptional regulator [Neorhizobium sp. BETTINA12A]
MSATNKEPKVSLREATYSQLKDLILNGQLRPSERLSENNLAKRFGVSRTPLREALMKLEEEGLVVGQRNLGYTVTDLDITGFCNLLVVREALDVCAAKLACEKATDEDLARLRDVIEQMAVLKVSDNRTPSDAAQNLQLGLHIHRVIAEATKNDALVRATDQIYQQLRLALWLEVLWVDLEHTDFDEHKAIADAILARDPEEAAKAASAHVQSSLKNMSKLERIWHHRRAVGSG